MDQGQWIKGKITAQQPGAQRQSSFLWALISRHARRAPVQLKGMHVSTKVTGNLYPQQVLL